MQITITLPKKAVDTVKELAQEFTGKKPTKAQLAKFFEQDITGLYIDSFDEGIDDAVEEHFG